MTADDHLRSLTVTLGRATMPGDEASLRSLTFRADEVADPVSGAPTRGVVVGFGGSVTVAVPHLRDEWGVDAARVADRLRGIADVLRRAQPADLVLRFPAVAARLVNPARADHLPGYEGWRVAARLSEAVQIVVNDSALDADPLNAAAIARPLIHRARFHLLTAPAVHPGVGWPREQVFGSTRNLDTRAEQARLDWALHLVNHEEHAALRGFPAAVIDTELRALSRPTRPPTSADSAPSEEEGRFRVWLAQEAYLPRFMLDAAWAAVRPPVLVWPILALLALVGFSPLVTLAWPGIQTDTALTAAAAAAGLTYLAVGLLIIHRPETAALWCLRLPAGAAIGIVALISVDNDWATTTGLTWLSASLVLLAVTIGYLITEAVGHGVPRGRTLFSRVLTISVLGYAHATAVAVITLVVVVPAVKPTLHNTLSTPNALAIGPATVLASSVGLAAGVLLQVLWDDRPVTYPLSHLPWRGRAR